MRFLLVNATMGMRFLSTSKEFSSTGSSYTPPIGLLYVAASLEDEGHEVDIIDYYCEKNPERTIQKTLASVDSIGLSVYSENLDKIEYIGNMVKNIDKDIPILIGGPHCTFQPNEALKDISSADISIEGEGEIVVKDLVKVIQGSKKPSRISGITYRKKGEIKKGKPPKVISDLDSISFPARHLVENYKYGKIGKKYFHKPKFTAVMTSRGCPFHCSFCTRHITTIETYRERSVKNVIQELSDISDRYNSVMFVDDNFTGNKKRVHKIMDWIIKSGTELDMYIQGARVDSADRDLYLKMKKAGVKHIYYGIESGTQEVLDFYNKKITLNQIRKAIDLSNEMDFLTLGTFILGAPIETKKHIEKTIEFACSLPIDVVIFAPLAYQNGSDLWAKAVKEGKITQDDGYVVYADKRRGLGKFTYEELNEYCNRAYNRFFLRPSYFIQQIKRGLQRKDLSLLRVGLGYL